METKISVLYVDDEENNLISFKATFRLKYTVYTALNGDQALQLIQEKPIDIVITDQRMPQMTGVELLEKIIKVNPDPMRILLTGYADMSAVVGAGNKGKSAHYLSKPWREEDLDNTVLRACEIYAERKKIADTLSQLDVTNDQVELLLWK